MDIYIGDLIDNARSDTQNADDIPSATTFVGIPTKDILRYANFAQSRLEGAITREFPLVFQEKSVIDLIADEDEYVIPDNVSLGTKIVKVEYSRTGNVEDYRRIPPGNQYNLSYRQNQYPFCYIRYDGKIQLVPAPKESSGTIRVWYIRAKDRLDIRRGQIDVITINGSRQITALEVDVASDDATELLKVSTRYLCVSSVDGTIKAYNIPVSGYNDTTGAFTLVGTPELEDWEAPAVGDYITIGRYTCTHSSLPNECESYITEYMNRRLKKRDSSKDVPDIDVEFRELEKTIIKNYQVPDMDVKEIPICDYDIFYQGSNTSGFGW